MYIVFVIVVSLLKIQLSKQNKKLKMSAFEVCDKFAQKNYNKFCIHSQVTVTPTRLKPKRCESKEPTEVIMAPFSSKSIVQFEDVPITKTARRILRVINPSEDTIEVSLEVAGN